jgi:DNA-binding SARP family transcriptional activator
MVHRGDWLTADVWELDDLWQQATEAERRGVPSAALDPMRRAVALWRDDPGELATEEWALPEVEERRQRVVGLACRAGELLLARGEPGAAREMGEAALRADPWSERPYQVVVTADLAAGDHLAARRALRRYREALADLGLDPADAALGLEQMGRRLSGRR